MRSHCQNILSLPDEKTPRGSSDAVLTPEPCIVIIILPTYSLCKHAATERGPLRTRAGRSARRSARRRACDEQERSAKGVAGSPATPTPPMRRQRLILRVRPHLDDRPLVRHGRGHKHRAARRRGGDGDVVRAPDGARWSEGLQPELRRHACVAHDGDRHRAGRRQTAVWRVDPALMGKPI